VNLHRERAPLLRMKSRQHATDAVARVRGMTTAVALAYVSHTGPCRPIWRWFMG
jgi:hypothetical protein